MIQYRRTIRLLILLCLYQHISLFGQYGEFVFERVGVLDGLPENSVKSIIQDHLGFLWLGTQNGLVRYDGYEMIVYQPDPNDPNSLYGGVVRHLAEDSAGNIWISTMLGICRFNRAEENFTRLLPAQYDEALYQLIASLQESGQNIAEISSVVGNEDRQKGLELAEETTLLIVSMGEFSSRGQYVDHGWIEDEDGNIVWEMDPAKHFWAGGEIKNKIQVALKTLPPGSYRLRYLSDNRHGYNMWKGISPSYPSLWGIRVLMVKNKPRVQSVLNAQYDPADSLLISPPAAVSAILLDQPRNTLWITSHREGLTRLNISSGSFTHYRNTVNDASSIPSNGLSFICMGREGALWIGSRLGLIKFIPETESFTLYQAENPTKKDKFYAIRTVFEDHGGILWVGSYTGGLFRFDKSNGTFRQYQHEPGNPNSIAGNYLHLIHEDRQGLLWLSAGRRLTVWDKETGHFQAIPRSAEPTGIDGIYPWSIFEDRTGTMWIGTLLGGLHKTDRDKQPVKHYRHEPDNINSLSANYIQVVHEDRSGNLWIGTREDGLTKLERKSHSNGKDKFTHYRHDPANPHSMSGNVIRSLFEDRSGNLWIGTSGAGLNRFDPENEEFIRYQHDPNDPHSLASGDIVAIYEDHSGTLWVGLHGGGGLNRYNPDTGTFTRYTKKSVKAILEDRAGSLWFGGEYSGLTELNLETEEISEYTLPGVDFFSIGAIYEDPSERLWVRTFAKGLFLFDRETGKFIPMHSPENLLPYWTSHIQADQHGRLWLGRFGGISIFDPETRAFKNFSGNHNIRNLRTTCVFQSALTGEMIWGGENGMVIFHPDSIKENLHPPQVAITSFKLFNQPVGVGGDSPLKKSISVLDTIRLVYWQNDISLGFAALHFNNPQDNQYSYILENYEENWRNTGNYREAAYTNLDPGEYIFRVKASNSDGVWNKKGRSLHIIITPPWWKTWWAYSLYFIFAIIGLYSARRYELSRQRLKHSLELEQVQAEKLVELDRMKSRFFANISHEFRTPLTLILGPLEHLISQNENTGLRETYLRMRRNGQRLRRLINQLLDLSKLESGKMSLQASPVDIVQHTKFIVMAFESLAGLRQISLKLDLPNQPVTVYLERDKFEKIIVNLLSNALKFTPDGGTILVIVDYPLQSPLFKDGSGSPPLVKGRPEGVEIRVKDTGIGIPADKLPHIFDRFYQADDTFTRQHEGTGIGLALTKALVELHGGTIRVESQVGSGTIFTVRLPLGKSHLQPGQIDEQISQSEENEEKEGFHEAIKKEYLQHSKTQALEHANTGTPEHQILIVEDNPDMREYMRGHLENRYRVIEAANGRLGLQQARQHTPELIISDVMMPEMNGFTLCEKLKTDARTSHIPVILLTARASGESKIEGLETGADDYLTKPFDAKELRIRIKNLIEQRRRLQERFRRELVIQPSEVTVTSMDEVFLTKVMAAVEAHIDDTTFDTYALARETSVSRRHLNRKLRALTGQSVREFIRTIRLKRAAQLLQQQSGTVTEIAYEVGFQSIAHFAKVFREQFGVAPSAYEK